MSLIIKAGIISCWCIYVNACQFGISQSVVYLPRKMKPNRHLFSGVTNDRRFHMKRKLYLDIIVFIAILGGFGVLIFLQQQAPATETQTQNAVDAPATGCCGASPVESETSAETAGGCCGTSKSDASQSVDNSQQVQPSASGTPETNETDSLTPQNEDADTGGCGCGG